MHPPVYHIDSVVVSSYSDQRSPHTQGINPNWIIGHR